MRVFLWIDKSMLRFQSLRTKLKVLGVLPKVNDGGVLKSDVLNHLETVGWLIAGFCPFQFGRCPPPSEKVVLVADEMPSGFPLANVPRALISQPPKRWP